MPAPARRAATVALLRDGDAGLEVFVMKRAASMASAPDMHVFPGGGVDAADGAPGDPGSTQAAARRELLEETGVVLPEWAPLAYFARWITPEPLPHRHDTDFFAAALPSGQEPGLVGTEAQDCGWTAPAAAIDDALAGRIGLLPPTAAAMYQLAAFPDVAGALDGLSREAGIRRRRSCLCAGRTAGCCATPAAAATSPTRSSSASRRGGARSRPVCHELPARCRHDSDPIHEVAPGVLRVRAANPAR